MIKLGPDLGAPLAVTAINLASEAMLPKQTNWFSYGMTAVGYLAGWAGWGGDILKNIGVASLPLSAKAIYDSVRGTPVSGRAVSYRTAGRVGVYPSAAREAPFQGVKLT